MAQTIKRLPATQKTQVRPLSREDFISLSELPFSLLGSSNYEVAQMVRNLPAMQEIQVQSLGWEDPLEKEMATHSSILAWRIPMDREAWWATVHEVTKQSDTTERLSTAQHSQYSLLSA